MIFSKRIFSVILALVMMFSIVAMSSVAASADSTFPAYDATKPSLSVGTVSYTGSGDVKVPIIIKNNPGIWGANFQVSYDSNLTYVEPTVDPNNGCSVLTGFCKATNDSTNRIVTVYVEASGLVDSTSDGTVLNLIFTPASYVLGTTYPITFTYRDRLSIINDEGLDLALTYANGGVKCVQNVITPATPVVKSVAMSAKNKVKVTWGAAANAKSYIVERKIGTGAWTKLATVSSTSYTDAKASTAGVYAYRVTAVSSTNTKSAVSAYKTVKVMSFSAKATIKSVKAGKKYVTVTIKKKVTNADGYQYQAGTNSKATKGVKKVTTTKTKVKIKGLKAKKTYYVKVRAYKVINGKKVYGAWSKVKKANAKTK